MKAPVPASSDTDVAGSLTGAAPERLVELLTMPLDDSAHLHGDKLRHQQPPHEQWWFLLKSSRQRTARTLPFRDKEGRPFTDMLTDRVIGAGEDIAQRASGHIRLPESVARTRTCNEDVVSSLIDEAITSSQLEGASASRGVAKDMLRSGRAPRAKSERAKSERMIVNNYRAMSVVGDLVHEDLTPDLAREIHRIVTDGTLDDPDDAGRLDRPGQDRVAGYGTDDRLLHRPPPAVELPQRPDRLCRFANGRGGDGP